MVNAGLAQLGMTPKPPSFHLKSLLGVFPVTKTLPQIKKESDDKDVVVIDDTELVDSELLALAQAININNNHNEEELSQGASEIGYNEDSEYELDQEEA